MATNTLKVLHRQAVRTEAEWESSNPIIPEDVMAFSSDNGKYKLGDGVKRWKQLAYPISNTDETITDTTTGSTAKIVLDNGSLYLEYLS